ncbi:MAG: hypothetical protein J7480_09785, partial [Microbacteriaceae bacterium]|nr:hypothetical protein [Microbacteriaceae bacterium]
MTGRRPIPVNVDLSTTQDPHHGERGIPAYARDFALAFDRVADLSAVEPLWVVDDAYPVPAALAPLAEAGRLVPLSEVAAHRPPLFTHLMSPMYGPGGRLDTKRWLDAHPVPVAMTVYDLVPYLMPDDYLGETSARARFHASLEWVKHADLL